MEFSVFQQFLLDGWIDWEEIFTEVYLYYKNHPWKFQPNRFDSLEVLSEKQIIVANEKKTDKTHGKNTRDP